MPVPGPGRPFFISLSRGLHTASVKFASGDISAAQRTLAPVLNDDWSKPCCMSNTMPPVQKYCHSYHDIPALSSGKNERRHKKNWSATDCLPWIQYFHLLPPWTFKLQGFSGRQETAQAVDRGGSWLGGTAGWHSWHHSTRQDVTAISTSIKTGLYSRHSCHPPVLQMASDTNRLCISNGKWRSED